MHFGLSVFRFQQKYSFVTNVLVQTIERSVVAPEESDDPPPCFYFDVCEMNADRRWAKGVLVIHRLFLEVLSSLRSQPGVCTSMFLTVRLNKKWKSIVKRRRCCLGQGPPRTSRFILKCSLRISRTGMGERACDGPAEVGRDAIHCRRPSSLRDTLGY